MEGRTTVRLLVATLVAASIWYVISWREDGDSNPEPQTWQGVADLPFRSVALTIQRGEWWATLRREGQRWRVVDPLRGFVSVGVVERLLNEWSLIERCAPLSFREMEVRGLTLARLGLDPPVVRLEAEVGDGQRIALRLGHETPLGDGLFAHLEGDSAVVVVSTNFLETIPSSIASLVNHEIWDFDWKDVLRIEVERRQGGFFQLARENGVWRIRQPFEDWADSEAVRSWLQLLWREKAEKVLWPESLPDPAAFGLDPATREAIVSFWTEGQSEGIKVYVGRAGSAEGERAYLQFAGSAAIYAVQPEWLRWMNVRVSDFRSRRRVRLEPHRVWELVMERGEQRIVVRRGTNELWQMEEPVQAHADRERVNLFLNTLTNIRAAGFAEEGEMPMGEEALIILRVRWASEVESGATETTKVIRIYAPLPESEFYRMVIGDAPPAFLESREIESLLGPPPFWRPLWFRDREMLGISASQIRSLTIQRGGAEQQTVRRDENGRWVGPEGRSVAVETVGEIVGTVGQMRADEVVPFLETQSADYGFDVPVVRLEIGLGGGEGIRKILLVGQEGGPNGLRYARVLGQDVVFLISPELFAFLNRDFLL